MKDTIRKTIKTIRSEIKPDIVEKLSRMICFRIANAFYLYDKNIALYSPINNEVNVLHLTKYKLIDLCLPTVDGNDIVFRKWMENDMMLVSDMNIMEPLPIKDIVIPAIAIVPIVAFDRACYRIGYGGGFYDKFLETFDGISIGVAFEIQRVSSIPIEEHDIALDYIVTERAIYTRGD